MVPGAEMCLSGHTAQASLRLPGPACSLAEGSAVLSGHQVSRLWRVVVPWAIAPEARVSQGSMRCPDRGARACV